MTEFTAEVMDIREESRLGKHQRWRILLDRTAFSVSAQTGTLHARSRSGLRLEVAVLAMVTEGDVLWHVVNKPLAAGTQVSGQVGDAGAQDG